VGEVADTREKRIAERKTPIVGVSEFPNLHEGAVERDPVSAEEIQRLLKASVDSLDLGAHRDRLRAIAGSVNEAEREPGALTDACLAATTGGADMYSVATVLQHGQPDLHMEPILQWRAAEVWEQIRTRSDQQPTRPVAFFANLGPIPSHKARSTWTQNLLAAVGIAAATNDGFDDMEALATAWNASAALLAVICGSDEDYAALLEPAVAALKKAGCPVVLVAGRPGEREAALREAGVSDFLFVGADVLTVMTEVLDSVGVY
jgi:methylmalonyl-CoA mutase